uniref:Uncharacterized protein n=1 Tax=Amphimedon queenslandica TaxID=400682 RepID=A0A1X7T7Z1_AMPQE
MSTKLLISPSTNITIKPFDKLILDASKTSDDGPKAELYQWDLISGGSQGTGIVGPNHY